MDKNNSEKKQFLVFRLLNEDLGVEIPFVREVLNPQEIHPLPQAPDFIEGVIDLRGRIIAVMDLRKRLNIKSLEDRSKTRIVICKVTKFIVGLIVDNVSDVFAITEKDIQFTPEAVGTQMENSYILGIAKLGERVIILLNLERILTENEAVQLSQLKQ